MTWADQCRKWRAERGWTQAEFASHLSENLSVRTVQKWEAEEMTPKPWAQDLIRYRMAAQNARR